MNTPCPKAHYFTVGKCPVCERDEALAALRKAEQERDAMEQAAVGLAAQLADACNQNDDLRAEVARLKAICNAVPVAEADKPGITFKEALEDHV